MIYTDGTIAIKAGSPIVTGTGTQWKKNIHGVAPGQLISIENGTAPVSMMIRAVNSDTELVLSFNPPVTLSGAKYSIATTVPDTISDAARTMSANQGYIVYFLQAMQQWMTDTGQVEIELPNGQKVTLEDLKGLASREWVNGMISEESTGSYIHDRKDIGRFYVTAEGSLYYSVKGVAKFLVSTEGVINTESNIAALGDVSVWNTKKSARLAIATVENRMYLSKYHTGKWQGETIIPDGNGIMATREWVNQRIRFEPNETLMQHPSHALKDFLTVTKEGSIGVYSQAGNCWRFMVPAFDDSTNAPVTIHGANLQISNQWDYPGVIYKGNDGSETGVERNPIGNNFMTFYLRGGGRNNCAIGLPIANGEIAVLNGNVWVDGSGYVKRSSPIIQIHPNGTFDTNDESEGAEVRRTGTGQYHISGILGYNSDGAWGVNGGISVPKDNNGLELVYVADRVLEDGSIIIETCHRQHAHLPERFQNWRLKEVTPEGERIFYQDGEPCDLPESTRLDVRIEMPQGSVWNVKQRELAEQMEREQAEREAQEAAEQAGDTEE